MLNALSSATSALQANSLAVEVLANNTANVNTPGFRPSRTAFSDVGGVSGVKVAATTLSGSQGAVYQTGNPSDLALEGKGYFQIEVAPGASQYSRSGVFIRDAEGFLRSPSGGFLMGQGGRIRIPQNAASYQVTSNGQVESISGTGQSLGSQGLQVVDFSNPNGLIPQGGSLWLATDASGEPVNVPLGPGGSRVHSGALEMSQTDMVGDQVQMILAQRAFEANARVISVSDEMLRKVYFDKP